MKTGIWQKVIFFALLIGIWVAVSELALLPKDLFPSPQGVTQELYKGFTQGQFWLGTYYSIQRVIVGYGLALLFGIGLGVFLGRVQWAENTLGSLIVGLQSLPSICWFPAAILWFGHSPAAIQMIVLMGAVFAITIATRDGMKNIPPLFLKAAGTLGITGRQLYRKVIFPAILPNIITGMKLGWSFAWRSLLGAELLLATMGLGQLLNQGRQADNINQIFAVMAVIVVIGLGLDRLFFVKLEKEVKRKWGLNG